MSQVASGEAAFAVLWLLSVQSWIVDPVMAFTEVPKFTELVAKIETDVVEFAGEVERMLEDRCLESIYDDCDGKNYDDCQSLYPNQTCLGGANYFLAQCSGVENMTDSTRIAEHTCSALYDFSVSTIRVPAWEARGKDGNPTEPILEAICPTLGMESWLQARRRRDEAYWEDLGVGPRSWYFGSSTGAFRIWPARHSLVCGVYDPRVRPWYVAAGSGPKNVVLIIDTSGSMDNGGRLEVAKRAAVRIISTLAISDRVTVVSFNNTARVIADENRLMFRATKENKDLLIDQVNNFNATGQTNFGDAFDLAFTVFNDTVEAEREVNCNSAILFLTDGENRIGMSTEEVTNLVTNRTSSISARLGKPVFLLTYSISQNTDVHVFPSELACAVENGVWTRIRDSLDIFHALSSYYRLFALGLGVDANRDFVAWVEPYNFATGNLWGTTASVPVYDRRQSPHLFLGVVGVDLSVEAIGNALGGANVEQIIESIALRSDASCPPELEITKCDLQGWSHVFDPGAGPQCGINCTGNDAVEVNGRLCTMNMPYPQYIFNNTVLKGSSYEKRVCCKVGESEPSDECPVVLGGQYSLKPTSSPIADSSSRGDLNPTPTSSPIADSSSRGELNPTPTSSPIADTSSGGDLNPVAIAVPVGVVAMVIVGALVFYIGKTRVIGKRQCERTFQPPPPPGPWNPPPPESPGWRNQSAAFSDLQHREVEESDFSDPGLDISGPSRLEASAPYENNSPTTEETFRSRSNEALPHFRANTGFNDI